MISASCRFPRHRKVIHLRSGCDHALSFGIDPNRLAVATARDTEPEAPVIDLLKMDKQSISICIASNNFIKRSVLAATNLDHGWRAIPRICHFYEDVLRTPFLAHARVLRSFTCVSVCNPLTFGGHRPFTPRMSVVRPSHRPPIKSTTYASALQSSLVLFKIQRCSITHPQVANLQSATCFCLVFLQQSGPVFPMHP